MQNFMNQFVIAWLILFAFLLPANAAKRPLPSTVNTPQLIVTGTASSARPLPATIRTGAIIVTGVKTPARPLPKQISTPSIRVTGEAP